ncbi:MAG: HAMP domain-containing histidine kinase [Oscillospiraceae bacterium]|nr:HAMP domain-containing histidine kinase [Oscillospiraceae bacterium]
MKKKKRFIKFFLWRFAVCAAAALVFVSYFCFYRDYKDTTEAYLQPVTDSNDYVRWLSKAETDDDFQWYLASFAGSELGLERSAVLYQPQTGETYVSSMMAIATVTSDNADGSTTRLRFYNYDPETLTRLAELRDGYGLLRVADIYAKDHRFVPGKVFQLDDPDQDLQFDSDGNFLEPLSGKWIDLTPSDTEGWTHYIESDTYKWLTEQPGFEPTPYDEEHLWGVVLSGPFDCPHISEATDDILGKYSEQYARTMRRIREYEEALTAPVTENDLSNWSVESEAEYREAIQKEISFINEYTLRVLPEDRFRKWYDEQGFKRIGHSGYHVTYDKLHPTVDHDRVEISFRGETWQLLCIRYFDPVQNFRAYLREYFVYEYYKDYLVPICAAAAAALLLAFLWALISYLIYSKRYDMTAYRRTLTGALAHDLKTPLTAISGYSENLMEHTHPDKADAYAGAIMENVQHMDSMIAGTLGLAELESHDKIEMQEVDLTALIADAFEKVQPVTAQRGLTVELSGTCTVRGNAEMLRQLALNLAANAAQHAAEGGKITVTGEGRTLRMQNPFAGELDEKAILEPFKRGSKARGRESGSGFGLSIVQQIAALHKAKLRVTARDGVFTAELRFRK